MSRLLVIFAVIPVAILLTSLARIYAIRRGLVDVPNQRSSHGTPTPRGGGVGIVAPVLIAVIVGVLAGWISPSLAAALGVGGLLIAVIGWIDDHRGLSPVLRGAIHLAAAVWAVAWLDGMQTVEVGTRPVHLGAVGFGVAVLAIVWAINLYNFMDGSDGLAGGEAMFVGLAAGIFSILGGDPSVAYLCFVVAAATGAFLFFNWSPARVFMGDVGSGFLGYAFGVLALASEKNGGLPIYLWMLLLGVFVFDASVTLARRVLRRESWYTPHRLHAYQRLIQSGWNHARVCTGALEINVLLAALVFAAIRNRALGPPAFLIGFGSLLAIYWIIERRNPMRVARSEAAVEPYGGRSVVTDEFVHPPS